ncbi:MAG: lipid II flippase MurJ [Bacillota bacterium]|jgi:peptidoglycan biosynthesis protein MviN/MurJ (putative lipid II flippase)
MLSVGQLIIKRIFDICFSLLVVIFLFPIFMFIALVIKISDGSPILFYQERVGLNGSTFKCLKFRSMIVDADNKKEELRYLNEAIRKWIKLLIILLLPVSGVLMVLRKEIVFFFFQTGVFSAEDTERTSYALMFYAVGLTCRALNTILNYGFYALKNMSQPVKAYSAAALVNLGLSLGLIPYLAHGGLALASSAGAIVNCGLLLMYLGRLDRLDKTDKEDKMVVGFLTKDLWVLLAKSILSSAVMTWVILLLKGHLEVYLHNYGRIGLALQAGVSVTVGMMASTFSP